MSTESSRPRIAVSAVAIDDVVSVGDTLRAAIELAVSRASTPLVLAVSGGRDSMTLMHAMATWAPESVATVATFDHASGQHATDASSLAVAEARRLGLTVVRERARTVGNSEQAWREARWEFLRRVARGFRARVATAHTRDDQLETVVLRLLRGTGARGLAALAAASPNVRPWLPLGRNEIAQWAAEQSVPFVHDPTNDSRRYLRSRVRHDLLPQLERHHAGFADEMLAVATKAAAWRHETEQLVDGWLSPMVGGFSSSVLHVTAERVRRTTAAGRAVVWPAIMARVGVTIDRHGLHELERFTSIDRIGAVLQLAGGGTVVRVRSSGVDAFELRPPVPSARVQIKPKLSAVGESLLRSGPWRLVPERRASDALAAASHNAAAATGDALWRCQLPRNANIQVRAWNAGDRIRTKGAPSPTGRRVARYLSEARIPTPDRRTWPVVIWEGEIVWIPGVCRSIAAPSRPGWSDLIWYRCEREHS